MTLEEAIAAAEAELAAEKAQQGEASASPELSLEDAIAAAEAQIKEEEKAAEAPANDSSLEAAIAAAQAEVAEETSEEGPRTQSWDDSIMARGDALLNGLLFGWGDEVSAAGRSVVGMALEGLDPNMEMEDYSTKYARERQRGLTAQEIEKENNPGSMMGLEIAGSLPSVFKAGAMVGNASTRLGNVGRQAGMGGGEMLSRELGKGEGHLGERVENVDPLTVGIGVGLGGAGGTLMRGQKAIDAKVPEMRNADGTVTETAFQNESNIRANLRNYTGDLYETVRDEVGTTEARMLSSADADANIARQQLLTEDRLPHKMQDTLIKAFEADPKAAKIVADAGAVVDGKTLSGPARVQMLDQAQLQLAKSSPEAAEAFGRMRTEMDNMQQEMREVFPNLEFEEGYMPITFKEKRIKAQIKPRQGAAASGGAQARETGILTEKQVAKTLNDPVTSFMDRWEDTVDALAIAKRYGVKADVKDMKKVHSFSDSVIQQVQKDYTEKLGEAGAQRLADNLRLFTVNGNQGMGPIVSLLRTTVGAALLGTPENAILQAGDLGVSAYQTSFLDAVKSLPLAIKSMFLTNGDNIVMEGYEKGLRAADIGISRQYFGEMFNKTGGFAEAEWLNKAAKGLQKFSDTMMQAGGVTKANRLGQEVLLNASYKQMKGMSLDKLKNSKYAEGLRSHEVDALYKGLQSGDPRDPAVLEAAFFAYARTQPGVRTAMPAGYLAMKNWRVIYNMKLFMTKIGRKMDTDVFEPYQKAVKYGLNTKAGQAHLRKATLNSARYMGYIVALNAVVDPGRKELMRGKESELDFPEQMARQGVSFATKGVIDIDREISGDNSIPPVVNLPFAGAEMIFKSIVNDELTEEDWNKLGRNLPGYRQVLWGEEFAEENL